METVNIFNCVIIILISIALFVCSIPADFYRGLPIPFDDGALINPSAAEKMEEFRINITHKEEKSLLSCLEDQTYSAINDFANCHLFCPLCYQGYGRCESTGELRICVCDCNFLGDLMQDLMECPWVHKLCTREAEPGEQAVKLSKCQHECQERGFRDAALCGADMDDPPLVRSTCTCLCP